MYKFLVSVLVSFLVLFYISFYIFNKHFFFGKNKLFYSDTCTVSLANNMALSWCRKTSIWIFSAFQSALGYWNLVGSSKAPQSFFRSRVICRLYPESLEFRLYQLFTDSHFLLSSPITRSYYPIVVE